ncbi:MAG: YlxR family protein [Desulfobulbaceae bacterium]|uniref:YlxR family protein n=1 Tax=Candidatus Desulfatifera sulfidica TaxID=2841691 RepID=A0A8J6TAF6_9BACT|nr:YlxR family protein [Candidatus Desulfatifera sulfidica]
MVVSSRSLKNPEKFGPIRMCVVCRKRDSKRKMLRHVLEQGVPVPDERQQKKGRGAYSCIGGSCAQKFVSGIKRWQRALRV